MGVPLFLPLLVRGTPFTRWHEILSQNTKDSKLSYSKNQKSLSHLYIIYSFNVKLTSATDRQRVVTDRHQERQRDTKTPGQNYA